MTPPLLSVVLLNFNGRVWLPRCLESLRRQTILEQIEVIVADNASSDGSDELARQLLNSATINGVVIQNGGNLGYCEGNNRGADVAKGRYLLFLNTDTWLEDDCLARLVEEADAAQADAASPMVLDYDDDGFQGNGASGFDMFGYLTNRPRPLSKGTIFAVPGCALLVRKGAFDRVGKFDPRFFMYADETDLAWRLTLCGFRTVTVPEARMHHRGAAAANPQGGQKVVEFRTTEMVRFFATRNSLLVILKNARNILLLLAIAQCLWVLLEMLVVLIITRKWGPIRRTYIRAFSEIWQLRGHVAQERRRLRQLRQHGDLWMLRFLRLRPGRWVDIQKLLRLGLPKLSPSRF